MTYNTTSIELVFNVNGNEENEMRRIKIVLMILLMAIALQGQTIVVNAEVDLDEWDIINLTDFDFNDGRNNPLIFSYRMSAPIGTVITFHLSLDANVPSLSINNEILLDASMTFTMQSDIVISSRDLDYGLAGRGFNDEMGNPVDIVDFNLTSMFTENPDRAQELQGVVLSSGSLPAGEYHYHVDVIGGDVQYLNFSNDRLFHIVSPSSIDLQFPIDNYQFIGVSYPVFEWTSQGCDNYAIRVCEFDPSIHSSYDDAMQSQSMLPYPDNGGFSPISTNSRFDYSDGYGRTLEIGKTYVWQVQKNCNTTGADLEIFSPIYSFSIGQNDDTVSECIQQIRDAIGNNQYNALFGPNGPLSGFNECPEFSIDGEPVSANEFAAIIMQIVTGGYNLESITTQ